MTDAIEALRGQLVLLHSLANDTTEANWRDKRLYILQTCVRMLDALAALDAKTPVTPADVEAETRERIAAALDEEADLIPCAEDAMVTRSNARLVRANFSYEDAERLEAEEAATAIRNLEPRHD